MGKYDKAIETLMEYCKDLRTKGGTSATHKQDVQVNGASNLTYTNKELLYCALNFVSVIHL